jgi:membrane protein implicated in regulation of membrane protease activity
MIHSILQATGIWTWWIAGAILIAIEVLAPGTFFLWFGLAAFAVGGLTMIFGMESAFWTWQLQLFAFALLAIIFVVAGRRFLHSRGYDSGDQPDLNERGKQLVGRMAVVSQAIIGGSGRVRIGDTTWRATGPDLEEGAGVVVVGADAATLRVEPQPAGSPVQTA